jgi:hypothetical protein
VYIEPDQKDWSWWLDMLQLVYNNATHSSHQSTPAKLLMGYKPRSPIDFLAKDGLTTSEGLLDLQKRVRELNAHRNAARDTIKHSAN